MSTLRRWTAYFSGRVQGVGFRYTARRIAERYALAGYVRNLDDGRVELVAEGVRKDFDAYLSELRSEMAHCSYTVQTHSAPATGEFSGFTIRR